MEQTLTMAIEAAKTSMLEVSKSSASCVPAVMHLRQTYQSYEDFNMKINPSTQVLFANDERQSIMGEYSTLAMLDMAFGPAAASAWVTTLLCNLNTFIGAKNMDDAQTKDLAILISHEYSNMKYSELQMFFFRFKCGDYGMFYGKVDPMVIICALKKFKEEIYMKKQKFINEDYETQQRHNEEHKQMLRKRWYDCQDALCKAATSEEMRKVFQNILYEDLYENDTVLILQVFPEEYAMIEKRFIQVFSPVIRRFYPNVKLNYRMRKVQPPKEDKEKEKLRKQISETLNSARKLIANEQGWDKDTIETAKYGFRLKYKLTPEDYIKKYDKSGNTVTISNKN